MAIDFEKLKTVNFLSEKKNFYCVCVVRLSIIGLSHEPKQLKV